jgi:hypothetical protein
MAGSILQLAKRDSKKFVTSGGFEETITMVTPTRDMEISLTGFATKHWINFDSDGNSINSKNVHICIDESLLVSKGYPVRNAKGEVSLTKHLVAFVDSSGLIKNYVVRESFPDETLGLIVLILGDYLS